MNKCSFSQIYSCHEWWKLCVLLNNKFFQSQTQAIVNSRWHNWALSKTINYKLDIMNVLNRKSFEVSFVIMCVVGVTFMIAYWFYKFETEDRDFGVVDYKSFEEATEVDYPVVSYVSRILSWRRNWNKLIQISTVVNIFNIWKEISLKKNSSDLITTM